MTAINEDKKNVTFNYLKFDNINKNSQITQKKPDIKNVLTALWLGENAPLWYSWE